MQKVGSTQGPKATSAKIQIWPLTGILNGRSHNISRLAVNAKTGSPQPNNKSTRRHCRFATTKSTSKLLELTQFMSNQIR